ncbi:Hypothetical predicted protein, partial [Marmota monax]
SRRAAPSRRRAVLLQLRPPFNRPSGPLPPAPDAARPRCAGDPASRAPPRPACCGRAPPREPGRTPRPQVGARSTPLPGAPCNFTEPRKPGSRAASAGL